MEERGSFIIAHNNGVVVVVVVLSDLAHHLVSEVEELLKVDLP